ncbi:cupin domain-containing protein [Halorientalis brevis]|uniref:Cupin domain-containing protein n=1 Tax=Halorientalis brevis TaxID=1126241 RepID=A0ABD6CCE3_9EURY|nr:cupin domain-containing protein [Halorientalis brevis]
MEKVSLDDVKIENNPLKVHSVRKPVSDALDTEEFAFNYFELEPGESFSGGMHRHHDQEELFYVLDGTATFETPDEEVEVAAHGCIRFARSEYQTGGNRGDELVRGFAIGAPGKHHDWDELEALLFCSECGEETDHDMALTDDGQFEIACQQCGSEPF